MWLKNKFESLLSLGCKSQIEVCNALFEKEWTWYMRFVHTYVT